MFGPVAFPEECLILFLKGIKGPSILLPQQYTEPPLSNSPEHTVGLHLTDILLNSQVRSKSFTRRCYTSLAPGWVSFIAPITKFPLTLLPSSWRNFWGQEERSNRGHIIMWSAWGWVGIFASNPIRPGFSFRAEDFAKQGRKMWLSWQSACIALTEVWLDSQYCKPGVVVHAHNPHIWKGKAGKSKVQSHLQVIKCVWR